MCASCVPSIEGSPLGCANDLKTRTADHGTATDISVVIDSCFAPDYTVWANGYVVSDDYAVFDDGRRVYLAVCADERAEIRFFVKIGLLSQPVVYSIEILLRFVRNEPRETLLTLFV